MTVPLSRLRWLILWLLFASTAINYIDRQALSVLLPTLREKLALNGEGYGTVVTTFLVAYTISQFISGILLDRYGTRRGMAWAVFIWGLAGLGHAFARGIGSFASLRFMLGLGEAANWPGGGKAISEWFPRERRAFAMGLFDGGSALGAIIAPPLVSWIALQWGWQEAFVVTGCLAFLWWGAWLLIYHPPAHHPWLSSSDREQAKRDVGYQEVSATESRVRKGEMLRDRSLWVLMAVRFASSPVWWFYVFWLPDFLSRGKGMTLAEIGLFGWIPYLAVDIGKIVGGMASDRLMASGWEGLRARKVVMGFGALAMAGGVMVNQVASIEGTMAWICVATFGFGLWSPNVLALHCDIFESDRMGAAFGLTGTAASIGGSISAYLIGRVVDVLGYSPVFLAAGVAPIFALLIAVFGLKHRLPGSRASTGAR